MAVKRAYLGAFLVVLMLVGAVHAATSDTAFVIVRCTTSISVDVLDTGIVEIPAGSPNDLQVSSYVTVRNDSSGSICKWSLQITNQEYSTDKASWNTASGATAWTMRANGGDASAGGVETAALLAVFKNATSAAAADFDADSASDDIIGTAAATTYDTAFVSNNNPYADAWAAGGTAQDVAAGSQQNLFFAIRYPSSVNADYYRRFTVTVTAAAAQ
jgi:hypothetical protein